MATRPAQQKLVPPYLPYKTFSTYIASLKAVGVPGRIDRYGLPNYSGGIQTWLLSALRFFELIDDKGTPQPALSQLVHGEGEARKTLLRDMLRKSYHHLFRDGLDLKTITNRQAAEQFKEYSLAPDTVDRCIAFFMGAARDAGIELSSHLKKPRKLRQANGANKASKKKKKVDDVPPNDQPPIDPPLPPGMKNIPIPLGPERTWSIHIESNYDQKDVDKFLKVIALVLGAESD